MNKFKVGDTIKCISNVVVNIFGKKFETNQIVIGKEYKVVNICGYNSINVDNGLDHYYYSESSFELVSPPFKVGDKVVYIPNNEVYKITEIYLGLIQLENWEVFHRPDKFILYSPFNVGFNVGDEVRICDDTLSDARIYKIVNIYGNTVDLESTVVTKKFDVNIQNIKR